MNIFDGKIYTKMNIKNRFESETIRVLNRKNTIFEKNKIPH